VPVAGAASAKVDGRVSTDLTARAAELFDQTAAKYPALNVSVRRRGELVWEREGGTSRTARDGVAADYNFYSTSKMLTGLAFAKLEQERGLNLSQSVRAIDPGLPAHYEPVTLRHLLTHTGGVRHYSGDGDWQAFNVKRCESPAEAIRHFIADPLIAAPGERLQYSSYGFVLLSHLLVKITNAKDYDAAMRQVLGDAYTARTDREGSDKAANYILTGGGLTQMAGLSAECKFGAGGLLASSRDLVAFGEALYQGKIIDLDTATRKLSGGEIVGGQANPFAYGAVTRIAEGVHVVGHSGGSPGGRSYLEVWLEPQVAVAVTGNLEGPGLGELAAGLAKLFSEANALQF
jgi:serine beta-lactamase-like protein LACTB